jgi:hypothetical protein
MDYPVQETLQTQPHNKLKRLGTSRLTHGYGIEVEICLMRYIDETRRGDG